MATDTHDAVLRERFFMHFRNHAIVAAVVAASAVGVVCIDPPHRLDLWVAEFVGTALVIGAMPLILARLFRVRDANVMLGSAIVAALLVASPDLRRDAQAREPVRGADGKPLPTASDGFGAYIRASSDPQQPLTHSL
ncbi:hypothetical protein KPL74_03095 [Bacillus sp. NP157]|nr:hypothetical protein KPL74_03095 [Bacillus sp. NP157]